MTTTALMRAIDGIKNVTLVIDAGNADAAHREYVEWARTGDDPAWVLDNPEATANTLLAVQQALLLPAAECKQEVQRLILAHIMARADEHVQALDRNGRRYEIEQDPQGRRSTIG